MVDLSFTSVLKEKCLTEAKLCFSEVTDKNVNASLSVKFVIFVILFNFFRLKYQVEYQYGGLTQNLTFSLEEQLCLSLLDFYVSCSTLELLRPYFFSSCLFVRFRVKV